MRSMCSPSDWTSGIAGARAGALLLLALLCLPAGCAAPQGDAADLLFVGGPVHTLEAEHGTASALAVKDGRILWVGEEGDAGAHRGSDTRVIDLDGRALLPGFIDSHLHLDSYARHLGQVDLVGTRSFAEVIERASAAAARLPPGTWVLGRGWDQNDWDDKRLPHHSALSLALPDHPVAFRRIDGHALLVNQAALREAEIDAESLVPGDGRMLLDDEGRPTGVLVDGAMNLITPLIPLEADDVRLSRTRDAIAKLHTFGITGIHDAGVDAHTISLFEQLARTGQFELRSHVMVRASDPVLGQADSDWPTDDLTGQGLIAVRGIKVSADGALGSRGAALLADYSDEPGHRGLVLAPQRYVLALARFALANGWQLSTHAIGDRANRLVLDAYEVALTEDPQRAADARFRVEHAQVLHPEDIDRFARLSIIPSMQAQHLTSDMPWAADRLGPERLRGAYAWRSLLDTGVIIPGGSDCPVERPDPIAAFHAAVTRRDENNEPDRGWSPEQAMTPDEALAHLTLWPAHAAFDERRLGSLKAGKLADLVVLNGDPMTLPDRILPALQVDLTVFDGQVVYERGRQRQPLLGEPIHGSGP